jgi:hypothetical protein
MTEQEDHDFAVGVGTHKVRTALDFVGYDSVFKSTEPGTVRFAAKYGGKLYHYTVKVDVEEAPSPFTVVGELTAVETPEGVKLV